MTAAILLGLFVALTLAIVIPIEGTRQRRAMKRRGEKSTGARMIGAGMLEVQHLLQADRHVEVLERQRKSEEVKARESDDSSSVP